MEVDFNATSLFNTGWGGYRSGRGKVLLREPEMCKECGRVFISLYALKGCEDHEGLEEV